jgi:polyvinyl alcohol dehydrogenase (cytochrome)
MRSGRHGWAGGAGRLTTACVLALVGLAGAPPAGSAATTGSSWTVYHGDPAGSGVAPAVTAVDTGAPAWTSPTLDGQLYGEPLVTGGDVFVATENDTVDALSASTGRVVWSTHVGTPVPSSDLPCGDITPTVGITGTPVIDPSRGELFAVADELVHGSPAHMLVGINTSTGAIELQQDVDPTGATPSALLQRTGLSLNAGRVVFAMGGNYGDCASYRGRVVAVGEAGGTPTVFTVDAASGDNQGAIWMGGAAPAIDAQGNIWVGVGNGSVYSASGGYDDSDSALELSPALTLRQYFAPSDWPANNAHDLDMSIAPALLADGQVVLAGKSRIIYLLNGSHLGGIGGQEASLPSGCGDDIDGGTAVVGTTVYLPCVTGPIAVQITASPPSIRVLWRAGVGGGPPIVAAGLVWTIGQNGVLYGLDPTSGAVRQRASIGVPANHFPTASVGDGLLLAPAGAQVVAFSATSASTASPTSSTSSTTSPASTTSPSSTSTAPPARAPAARPPHAFPTAAVVVGALAVIALGALAVSLLRRRRRPGPGAGSPPDLSP